MASIRRQIVDKMRDALIATGAFARVDKWLPTMPSSKDWPQAAVFAQNETVANNETGNRQVKTLSVTIEITVEFLQDAPEGASAWDQLEELVSVAETAILANPQWDGLAHDTSIETWGMTVPEDTTNKPFASLPFTVQYRQVFGQPEVVG